MTDSPSLHEPADLLKAGTLDKHRAYRSLMEELDAIDWYTQRIDAAADDELKAVLTHNRDEEAEHAAMVLEWLRRHEPPLDRYLRKYLFTDGPIRENETGAEAASPKADSGDLEIRGL